MDNGTRPGLPMRIVLALGWLFAAEPTTRADWRADIGYPQLSAELGTSLPTGAGIIVLQTEAGGGMPQASSSSPFAGAGNYLGKTFTMDSTGMSYSGHADSVATNFYGDGSSASPGVTDVHLMDADAFINAYSTTSTPPTVAGSVHNHSWIGTTTGDANTDNYYLRAFDFQINRDAIVATTPLNNGTDALPTFMANSYHSISVGLRNGGHSLGGSTADGIGRMKPDVVVNESYTSFAAPAVASVAAMLRQAIKASYTTADHPQAIKAIILAGASKTNLPGWRRAATTAPYDSTFGAGELNVLNAWHILAKGRQAASTSAEVSRSGWDYNTGSTSNARRYFFTVPAGSFGNTFSAALTWHRSVTHTPGTYGFTMANLTLKLYASSGLVAGAVIDQSNSSLDNVEHIFQRNLPAGQYALEVSSNTNGINYGLAWETQTGSGPQVSPRAGSSGEIYLDLSSLDPFVTYTISGSTDLVGWSNVATVRTADSAASTAFTWQDTGASPTGPKFYRLQWTAVR